VVEAERGICRELGLYRDTLRKRMKKELQEKLR
jgi:hypothetical protein